MSLLSNSYLFKITLNKDEIQSNREKQTALTSVNSKVGWLLKYEFVQRKGTQLSIKSSL